MVFSSFTLLVDNLDMISQIIVFVPSNQIYQGRLLYKSYLKLRVISSNAPSLFLSFFTLFFLFCFLVTTLSTGQLIFVSFFYDKIFLHSPFLFNRTKGTFAIFSDSIVTFSGNAFARKELSSFVAIKFSLCSHRSALFLGNLFLLGYSPQMDMYIPAFGDVIFVCHK